MSYGGRDRDRGYGRDSRDRDRDRGRDYDRRPPPRGADDRDRRGGGAPPPMPSGPLGGGFGGPPPMGDNSAFSAWGVQPGAGGGFDGGYDRMAGLGADLRDIDYRKEQNVVELKKNFYNMTQSVEERDPQEIEEWRRTNQITTSGRGVPNPVLSFEETNFPRHIIDAFYRQKFEKPTMIQSQGWTAALSGRDIVGIAKTGSGKTLAFGVPALIHAEAQPPLRPGDGPIVLILAPTRELAIQIEEEMNKVMPRHMHSVCVYGGAPKSDQGRKLRRGVHVCIATPGRLIDFISSRETNLRRVTYLVMDEADRMLDMGFEPQIRTIVGQIRPERQTLLWSATWPREVQTLARDFQQDWIQIQVGSLQLQANADVNQHFILAEGYGKLDRLVELCKELGARQRLKVLVFTGTKRMADDCAHHLQRAGYRAMAIHGDKQQRDREYILTGFRKQSEAILVATDVAARGLDIRDLRCVVNYDFPSTMEDYVHRIGRTGRAGDKGDAFTFLGMDDAKHCRELVRLLQRNNAPIPQELEELMRYAPRGGGGGGGRKGGKGGKKGRGGYGQPRGRGGTGHFPTPPPSPPPGGGFPGGRAPGGGPAAGGDRFRPY